MRENPILETEDLTKEFAGFIAVRSVNLRVARGSIPYSPEIHPLPELRKNAGTASSTEAVQITRVFPISISAEPSAVEMKSGTMLTGRICSAVRLSLR